MIKYFKDLWFGKKSLTATNLSTTFPLTIYLYLINFVITVEKLSFYIFSDIVIVILAFFSLACIWRSSENQNKIYSLFSKSFSILIVIVSIYYGYARWII